MAKFAELRSPRRLRGDCFGAGGNVHVALIESGDRCCRQDGCCDFGSGALWWFMPLFALVACSANTWLTTALAA